MCTRFCYKKMGHNRGFGGAGIKGYRYGGKKNITSIHILIPLFYKDSPQTGSLPPYNTNNDKRNYTWSKKNKTKKTANNQYIIKYNTNCTVHSGYFFCPFLNPGHINSLSRVLSPSTPLTKVVYIKKHNNFSAHSQLLVYFSVALAHQLVLPF